MNTHRKVKPYLAGISDHSPLLKNVNQGKLNRVFLQDKNSYFSQNLPVFMRACFEI